MSHAPAPARPARQRTIGRRLLLLGQHILHHDNILITVIAVAMTLSAVAVYQATRAADEASDLLDQSRIVLGPQQAQAVGQGRRRGMGSSEQFGEQRTRCIAHAFVTIILGNGLGEARFGQQLQGGDAHAGIIIFARESGELRNQCCSFLGGDGIAANRRILR